MSRAKWHPQTNRYRARVTILGTPLCGYGKSIEEAEQSLLAKIKELESRLDRQSQVVDAGNLNSFWETAYLPSIETRGQKWKNQIAWAKAHLEPLLGLPMTEIDRAMIQSLLNQLSKKLSPMSVRHVRRILFGVLELAVADEIITTNPAKYTKGPKVKRSKKPVPCYSEIALIIENAKGSAAFPTIVLSMCLGLRLGEIQRLEPSHFSRPGLLIVPGTKSDNALRTIPLPKRVKSLLKDCTFPLAARSQSSANKAVKRVWPSGSPQDGRHTFNTGMQETGCMKEIREHLMGHRPSDINSNYSHSDMIALASEWLEKYLDRIFLSTSQLGTALGTGS